MRGHVCIIGPTDHRSNYVDKLPDRCGKCGGDVTFGHGFAYGGFGSYVICLDDSCDWHAKKLSDPKDE